MNRRINKPSGPKRKSKWKQAFTLVEMMMTVVIVSFMFVAVNSMLVMVMKRHMVNSAAENQQMMCQRAMQEMNGYVRVATTVQLLDDSGNLIFSGGSNTAANTLQTLDVSNNITAKFVYLPDGTGTGQLTISVGAETLPYSTQIMPGFTNSSGIPTNVFTLGSSGFINYSFTLTNSTDATTYSYSGAARPNL